MNRLEWQLPGNRKILIADLKILVFSSLFPNSKLKVEKDEERGLKHFGFHSSFWFGSEAQCVLVQGRFPSLIAKILKYPSMGIIVSSGLLTSKSAVGISTKHSEELRVMILAITGVMRTSHVH